MTAPRTLVLACGALINELQAVRDLNGLTDLTIDEICAGYEVTRLEGAHCYEFFAGADRFHAQHTDDSTNE
jgi:hypothetical protein